MELFNCEGSIYVVFVWFLNNVGVLIGDNIYVILVQGIGICVKVWFNISGEYGDDIDDFSFDLQVYYIGDVNYYFGKLIGFFDFFVLIYYILVYQLQLVVIGGVIVSKS